MKKSSSEEGSKEYQINLVKYGRMSLVQPDKEETIKELCDEGDRLLALENQDPNNPIKDSVKKNLSKDSSISNPYLKAREKILNDMSDDRKNRILQMEANGKTNDKEYKNFIDSVIQLGDNFPE